MIISSSARLRYSRRSPLIAWKSVMAQSTGKQLGRILELVAQLAGAREDRLDFRRRPSLHQSQRQPTDHLQPELLLDSLGAFGQPAQRGQPPLGQRQRLPEREEPYRALGGDEK